MYIWTNTPITVAAVTHAITGVAAITVDVVLAAAIIPQARKSQIRGTYENIRPDS